MHERKSFAIGLPLWRWTMMTRLKFLMNSRVIWNKTIDHCLAKAARKKKLCEERSLVLATGRFCSGKSNHLERRSLPCPRG